MASGRGERARALVVPVALGTAFALAAVGAAFSGGIVGRRPSRPLAATDAARSARIMSGSVSPPTAPAPVARFARPPVEPEMDQPVVRRRTGRGAMVVWAEEDGDATHVLAGFEKAPGQLVAPAKVLRRTPGKVVAIDVVDDAGPDAGVVVAWASWLGEGKGQVIGLVTASTDLARVSGPTTLGIVAAEPAMQAHIAVARNPRGGVVVAHQGPPAPCRLLEHDTTCVTFEVKAVSPSEGVQRLGQGEIHGGPSPELRLVDVDGRALLVYASSMRGGRTSATAVLPYVAGAPAPAFHAPSCAGLASEVPDILRGASGELVAVCIEAPREGIACARPLRGDRDRCLRVAVTGADGKPITVKDRDAAVLRVACTARGTPRLDFPSGSVALAGESAATADFVPATCFASNGGD